MDIIGGKIRFFGHGTMLLDSLTKIKGEMSPGLYYFNKTIIGVTEKCGVAIIDQVDFGQKEVIGQ